MELIYKEGSEIVHTIYTNIEDAENCLKGLRAELRLDYHNVIHLIDHKTVIFPEENEFNICVISYVRKFSKFRQNNRKDIKRRIESGQIDFGILVFRRDYNKNSNFTFHVPGSKAWTNKLLQNNGNIVFIDDGLDHIESVKSLNINNLSTVLFWSRDGSTLLHLLKNKINGILESKYIVQIHLQCTI